MKLQISRENYYWTDHVRAKMRQYRLAESRVKRVLRHPRRLEVGVAEDTVAGMQPAGSKGHPYEIWVMWTTISRKPSYAKASEGKQKLKVKSKFSFREQITIISAWRYPGISPVKEPPPIPDDVWEALLNNRRLSKI